MTDALVYRCDDTSCYWNHGQACTAAQIDLNVNHKCTIYIERSVAEEAILQHVKAGIK